MERLVQFRILGQNFKVFTSTGEEDMEAILSLLREAEKKTVTDGGRMLPTAKSAVMVSLDIASKYIQLQREMEQLQTEMDTRLITMNDLIETDLMQENASLKR